MLSVMKTIDQDELFRNVTQFLQGRGVELKEGSYTKRLQQCCGLLADVVNTTNHTLARACAEVDRKLKDIRQTVRGRRGPKPPPQPEPVTPEPTVVPEGRPQPKGRRKPPVTRARPANPAPKRAAVRGKGKSAGKSKGAS
jgi:hypothetical protein